MKSVATRKKPPATPAEWEALIAAVPGKDRELTPREEKKMANSVVVPGGGYAAVKEALVKRRRGKRGPQVAATKQLVSVRFSPEVLLSTINAPTLYLLLWQAAGGLGASPASPPKPVPCPFTVEFVRGNDRADTLRGIVGVGMAGVGMLVGIGALFGLWRLLGK